MEDGREDWWSVVLSQQTFPGYDVVGYLFDWTDWGNGQLMFCPVMGVDRFDSLSWQRNLGCWWRRRVEKGTIAGNLMTFLVVKVGVMIDEMGIVLNGNK